MKCERSRGLVLWLAVLPFAVSGPALATEIAQTKHNLSLTGPGELRSSSEEEICIFCHAPHNARSDIPFLWNREDSTAIYSTYQSSTLMAAPGQPSGASKLCLSCHDGTIALGSTLTRAAEIPFAGGVRFLPAGRSKLGTDLADDHPVSITYQESSVTAPARKRLGNQTGFSRMGVKRSATTGLVPLSALPAEIILDDSNQVQCTSCHDPHDDTYGDFLVLPLASSTLCVACHSSPGWQSSVHALSGAVWNGSGPDPWTRPALDSVALNGCLSCHTSHAAGGPEWLLNYPIEENNCLVCHNGNVAATDIESELSKSFSHSVQNFLGQHDPAEESPGSITAHVECTDCHNSHRVTDATATAPDVPGSLLGVSGVSSSGVHLAEASFTYEICFKCHADHSVSVFAEVSRQIPQLNTRLEFDLSNPSYHPVEGSGSNPNVPSLLPPYSVSSVIYCTDCHGNDDSFSTANPSPRGPHGSNSEFLLVADYSVRDGTRESAFEYALCYSCHDRNSILGGASFPEHEMHILDEATPCSVCHDPHGISSAQGNPDNHSNLINFDVNVVSPNGSGRLLFEDLGLFTGRCYLSCHGLDHAPEEYP